VLNNAQIDDIVSGKIPLSALSSAEKLRIIDLLDEKTQRLQADTAKIDLVPFAHAVYPGYSVGAHHKRMAELFKAVADGTKKRIIINIAPRFGKSELSSYLFPAWFLGQKPDAKIIMATHTASLSEDFGRRVRNLITTPEYQRIFPGTQLSGDSKSAGAWNTSVGGKYYAVGVGGALAGRGADLLVIDDPHALEVSTLVATTQGFKTVSDLKVGDFVFGPDGVPTEVLSKSMVWDDRPLYEVATNDGEIIKCDGGHLWNYRSDTKLFARHKNSTARDLAYWDKTSLPCMPRHKAVEYAEQTLPIDPYILGAWLGDGTSSLGRMTSHPDDAVFMRGQFIAAGYTTTTHKDLYSFGVLGLRAQLTALNVLNNKHIPEAYLIGSVAQRIALLQGLMDTDGTCTEAGQCSFQNTNHTLALGFRELLQSLGVKARMCVYEDKRGRHASRKLDYRINFKLKDSFRMPRKNTRTFTPTDKQCRSFTVRMLEEKGSVQCITVARKDGLFLVGRGYVVTHNSEQDARSGTKTVFDQAWMWYQTGPRQRLMWGGAIILVMTRWSPIDLTGRLLEYQAKNPDADQWEVIEFPAILPSGKSLWPEKWPVEELNKTKATLDAQYWNAQYQQQPTSEEAAIIKREMWREWASEKPPLCTFILQSWDTAHEAKTSADYSACTTWGLFLNENEGDTMHIILLDAFKGRYEFPELKKRALEAYKEWEPDICIIEKKAAGAPLIQELRRAGIPISEYSPSRGNDKTVRINAVADVFASGKVWAPAKRWARDVIEEMAAYPQGEHDDLADTCTQAILRFRQGGFIPLPVDEADEPNTFRHRAAYY